MGKGLKRRQKYIGLTTKKVEALLLFDILCTLEEIRDK